MPGNYGIAGNEIADEMARTVLEERQTEMALDGSVRMTHIRSQGGCGKLQQDRTRET